MKRVIIAGIGTEVGKTITAAIITKKLQANYWKPIQSGSDDKDTDRIRELLEEKHQIFPPAYDFKAALSPHHAARLENITIDPSSCKVPKGQKPLVIEMAGGILVPLTHSYLSIELFSTWQAWWILVSKHYLGSINHTLLTIEALTARKVPILGIVFNGKENPDSEKAILSISSLPMIGRLYPEPFFNRNIIEGYAKKWSL